MVWQEQSVLDVMIQLFKDHIVKSMTIKHVIVQFQQLKKVEKTHNQIKNVLNYWKLIIQAQNVKVRTDTLPIMGKQKTVLAVMLEMEEQT